MTILSICSFLFVFWKVFLVFRLKTITLQLFSKLVDCAESAAATRDISADVGVMLQPVVGDVQAALTSHLQNVGDELVRCARSQCSTLMSSATLTDQLKKSVDSRSLFPAAVVQSALVDGAVDRLLEKTNEMAAAMALQVGELLVDQLIESLTDAHQSLTGDVAPKKRSSTPDVLKSRTRLSSEPQITAVSNEPLSLLDQDHRHQDPVGRHSPVVSHNRSNFLALFVSSTTVCLLLNGPLSFHDRRPHGRIARSLRPCSPSSAFKLSLLG